MPRLCITSSSLLRKVFRKEGLNLAWRRLPKTYLRYIDRTNFAAIIYIYIENCLNYIIMRHGFDRSCGASFVNTALLSSIGALMHDAGCRRCCAPIEYHIRDVVGVSCTYTSRDNMNIFSNCLATSHEAPLDTPLYTPPICGAMENRAIMAHHIQGQATR